MRRGRTLSRSTRTRCGADAFSGTDSGHWRWPQSSDETPNSPARVALSSAFAYNAPTLGATVSAEILRKNFLAARTFSCRGRPNQQFEVCGRSAKVTKSRPPPRGYWQKLRLSTIGVVWRGSPSWNLPNASLAPVTRGEVTCSVGIRHRRHVRGWRTLQTWGRIHRGYDVPQLL